MKTRALGIIAVAAAVLSGRPHAQTTLNPIATEFVGTTPCGAAIRAFVGGLGAGAACHAITWRIDLGVTERNVPGWSLVATYGVPAPSNPGAIVDGPRVSSRGRLEKFATTYRLISDTGQSISLRQVSSTLVHVLDEKNRLMIGTTGWSYTLSRADVTDDPGRPSETPGASYTVPPRETGNAVFGIFGGRTPCMGIVRALRIALTDGCQRVKWRITLLQKAGTREPTTYKIEGSLHRTARQGAWRIVRGTASDPDAVVYQLDATAAEGPMLLWKADDNVLFLLDEHKRPLVGTIDLSYTLNWTE